MKVGDIVMFIDKGTYAKWFFGKIGRVVNFHSLGSDGKSHCRVRWIKPVSYFDRQATISDFCADKFEVLNENR
tara:strand:+ start:1614 stop:1832 length:219 start_codon:yes stop_codon:yes gene_type:complete